MEDALQEKAQLVSLLDEAQKEKRQLGRPNSLPSVMEPGEADDAALLVWAAEQYGELRETAAIAMWQRYVDRRQYSRN